MAVVVVATAADAHPDATTVDKQQKPTDNRPWAFFIPQGFPMRTLVLFLLLATSASAQDMPLRDFIPDGDGWKLVPDVGAMPAKVAFEKLGDKTPNAAVKSHDGTTPATAFTPPPRSACRSSTQPGGCVAYSIPLRRERSNT